MAVYFTFLALLAVLSGGAWVVLALSIMRGRARREALAESANARLDALAAARDAAGPTRSVEPVAAPAASDYPSFLM